MNNTKNTYHVGQMDSHHWQLYQSTKQKTKFQSVSFIQSTKSIFIALEMLRALYL
jgi:hypothetical protein